MKNKYFYLLGMILYLSNSMAQNNYFDLSYCGDGTCNIELPISSYHIEHMSFDSLENLYITSVNSSSDTDARLVKLTKDGVLDSSFGEGGIYEEPDNDYKVYQKDNYIYSLRIAGGGTAINMYDLELNFIQRFVLADVAQINQLHYNEKYFIGSTLNGFLFKYEINGQIDEEFADNGIYDLELNNTQFAFGSDGYAFTTTDDTHYCYKSSFFNNGMNSVIYEIDNKGILINEFTLETNTLLDQDSLSGLDFTLGAIMSYDDELIVHIEHLTHDYNAYQSEFLKIDRNGDTNINFGEGGSIFPTSPNNFQTTSIIGELNSQNLVFTYNSRDPIDLTSLLAFFTTSLFIMKPDGTMYDDFGNGGYLNLDEIRGNYIYRAIKPKGKDHIYIISSDFGVSSRFYVTKLNLESLQGTPFSTTENPNTFGSASILLYPNPSAGSTHLQYAGPPNVDCTLQLTNTYGQTLSLTEMNNLNDGDNTEIETKGLSDGVYYISLINSGGQIITAQRLVVTH